MVQKKVGKKTLIYTHLLPYWIKSAWENIFLLFLNQNICCGYSKEPSQWDGSFEHTKHQFKLIGKKIFGIWSFKLIP